MNTLAAPATPSSPLSDPRRLQPVAPGWHTGIFVAALAIMAVMGGRWQRAGAPASSSQAAVLTLYLSLLALEWGLFRFVLGGIRRRGATLTDLIGRDARSRRGLLVDGLLGLACWCVFHGIQIGWQRLLGQDHATSVQALLPRQPLEIVLWIAVCVSAAICEETAFRGYCQRQFSALTQSSWLAVLMQSAVFALGHAYQGWGACTRIMLVGLVLGAVAQWRGQLRAGMIAHACADITAGLFGV